MEIYKEQVKSNFNGTTIDIKTIGDLGKELLRIGKSYDLAGRYLGNLTKKGIIKKIKHGYYVFTHNTY